MKGENRIKCKKILHCVKFFSKNVIHHNLTGRSKPHKISEIIDLYANRDYMALF